MFYKETKRFHKLPFKAEFQAKKFKYKIVLKQVFTVDLSVK